MTKLPSSSFASTLALPLLFMATSGVAGAQDVAAKTKVPANKPAASGMSAEKAAPTLANAAERGDIAAVRALLTSSKGSLNVPQGDGMTALHWAAERGDLAMAQLLIKSGANLKATTRLGSYTPLHVAAQKGRGSVVRALLAAGADVNATTIGGSTALHYAAETSSAEAVDALIEYKANVNAREKQWGQTPLMYAASANRPETIRELLTKGKADPNLQTESLELAAATAAEQAATRRRNEVMQSMLPQRIKDSLKTAAEKAAAALPTAGAPRAAAGGVGGGAGGGAPPAAAATTAEGVPAGAAAAANALRAGAAAGGGGGRGPQINYAQWLTAAQVQQAIAEGRKTLDSVDAATRASKAVAAQNARVGRGAASDTVADVNGNLSNNQFAAGVGAVGGLAALHHAVRQGNTAATLALLDGGADINERTVSDSTTPLLMAIINGHFDLAMELVKRGADVKIASSAGATPLYNAINSAWLPRSRYPQPQGVQVQKTTHYELMAALIKAGADVNARLKKNLWYFGYNNCGNGNCGLEYLDGTTPFWRASYAVDLEAMKMLVAAGADVNLPSIRPQQAAGGGRGGAPGAGAPGAAGAAPGAPGAAGAAAGAPGAGRGGRGAGGGGGAGRGGDGAAAGGGGGGGGLDDAPQGGGGRGALVLTPEMDSASKAVPPGIGVYPIHAVAGVGYGNGFAGNSHRHAPDGWMPAMKYVVEVLKADVNQRDNNGFTPLHHAAARGDNEMILYLISKGADPKAVSRRGLTTIDIANSPVERLRPFPETIELLKKYGVYNSNRCTGC
ncbi:MAG: ankyrin repeat domain-containing protein [Gemmatimonas sp.]